MEYVGDPDSIPRVLIAAVVLGLHIMHFLNEHCGTTPSSFIPVFRQFNFPLQQAPMHLHFVHLPFLARLT